MNITELSKLIAEFMAGGDSLYLQRDYITEQYYPFDSEELAFHISWDWLMPVVEKIEMLGYTFEKNYQENDGDWQSLIVKGNDILFQEFNRDSKLSTFYVVVKFIQWYNQNQTS